MIHTNMTFHRTVVTAVQRALYWRCKIVRYFTRRLYVTVSYLDKLNIIYPLNFLHLFKKLKKITTIKIVNNLIRISEHSCTLHDRILGGTSLFSVSGVISRFKVEHQPIL